MAEDVDKVERARLAREEIIDHMNCDDCTEDYVFLLKQGGREFGMGLTTVLSMLAFAEYEGAVPPLRNGGYGYRTDTDGNSMEHSIQ